MQSSGYLCSFEDLLVRSVLLDEVLLHPEQCRKDNIVDREARSLRDLREMVGKISLEDTKQYIQGTHKIMAFLPFVFRFLICRLNFVKSLIGSFCPL